MRRCARLTVDVRRPDLDTVRRASSALRRGEVVAALTDTVYGLLADATDPAAIGRVFRAKGRPDSKPVLVLIDRLSRVRDLAEEIPEAFATVASRFWPGPLTVVLPAKPAVRGPLTAGMDTVAIRLPRSPLVRALARHANRPLTGTSANLSGRPGGRSADEVWAHLGSRIPLLLDSGAAARPVPSTIVDLASGRPRVLRNGPISRAALCMALRGAGLLELQPNGASRPT